MSSTEPPQSHDADDARAIEILEGIDTLPEVLARLGTKRALILTTPGRRFVDGLPLEDVEVEVFDGAKVHVPREVVDAATQAIASSRADTLITLGGGSATGLGKALRLTHDVRFIAIPTTYSGSEMTRIHAVTEGGDKRTGRDPRARPDVVLHEPTFFETIPRRLAVTSLLNAIAHPISALSRAQQDAPDEEPDALALRAIETLSWALDQLVVHPGSPQGRRAALRGMASAGRVLDAAPLGRHHQVAHLFGGRFGLEHAALHSVLLPAFVRSLADQAPALYQVIAQAAGHADLPAALADLLTLAGAPRSLHELGVSHDAFEELARGDVRASDAWIADAQLGRRPSIHTRRVEVEGGARPSTSMRGPQLADARRVVLVLHGRGSNADRMLRDALDLTGHDPSIALVAPQAPRNAWYSTSFRAPLAELGEAFTQSLAAARSSLDAILAQVPPERVFVAGFSQGACLATELVARHPRRLGGLVAIAGARPAPPAEQLPIRADLSGMAVLLGVADQDAWVRTDEVAHTAAAFREAGADVRLLSAGGAAHELTARQRIAAREILRGPAGPAPSGFGNAHEGEALPGALPRTQNSPHRVPYGLHAEQINGTGFHARRHEALRTWMYRIRPSARHEPFERLEHATFRADFGTTPADPNLAGYRPLAPPTEPTDFVDGLATFGGAGHPDLRRGYAIHLYVANRSMEHRAFYDADGDLLIVPQEGALTVQTELGSLDVAPGQIAIVPRGLKLSVHLHGAFARGYVGEVYGRHFELPERGPIGANGLADARHFFAPVADFEERLDPGYRITAKHGNELFEATQDGSPYDVVAWHGTYAPHVFDLAAFCPVGNVRFDHPDPSIYLVIGAPLDEQGADSLDFVFFPPRWEVSEHTFRPPFFHRNATTEFNGIVNDPSLDPEGPFAAGGYFLTPSMTAHAVMARAVEAALRKSDADADRAHRSSDESMWFQFEAALPIRLTSWAHASANRVESWPQVWGAHRARFSPTSR